MFTTNLFIMCQCLFVFILFLELSPPRGEQAQHAEEETEMSANEFRRANQFLNNVSFLFYKNALSYKDGEL